MKRFRLLAVVLILLAVAACASQPKETVTVQRLTILHFNDMHGYLQEHRSSETGQTVGGFSRLAALVDRIRQENDKVSVPTMVLYAGDLLTGSPLSSLYRGEADIELLNRLGIDGVTVGNHDLDLGRKRFDELVQASKFPWLVTNLTETGKAFPWLPMGVSKKFANGLRVGVIGVTTDELVTQTNPKNVKGLEVGDPVRALPSGITRTGGPGSIKVVLSHCGLTTDKRIAREIEGIHVIIGGHNQKVIDPPLIENGVIIVQAGKYAEHLGRLDLEKTGDTVRLVRYKMYDITPDLPPDRIVQALVDGYVNRMNDQRREEIGRAVTPLNGSMETIRSAESNLGDFVCDLIRTRLSADVVLLNGGGFRSSIGDGPITVGDVLQVFPFGNTLYVLSASGATIRAALERGLQDAPDDNPGAFLQVSGLRYQIDGKRAVNITVAGQPLDENKNYKLVINDFMAAGGDRFTMFQNAADAVDSGVTMADAVIEAIRQQKDIDAKTDGRIERISPWQP
ncbi:MAG: bifunctional metallophosphatase/5'-nucleotidase [Myxococcales bacterium]|nr:bifunctional metallophosphatase/5'-nucleotidase [Myxococcales bacterium]